MMKWITLGILLMIGGYIPAIAQPPHHHRDEALVGTKEGVILARMTLDHISI